MRLVVACLTLIATLTPVGAFEFSPLKPIDTKAVDPAILNDFYGAWEIRDRSGRKRCRVVLLREPAIGGNGIEVASNCAVAFPVMGDIAAWRLLENWTIDLVDPLRKTRVRLETPDNRYVAFGEAKDIAGMDDIRKVPDKPAPAKRK